MQVLPYILENSAHLEIKEVDWDKLITKGKEEPEHIWEQRKKAAVGHRVFIIEVVSPSPETILQSKDPRTPSLHRVYSDPFSQYNAAHRAFALSQALARASKEAANQFLKYQQDILLIG